LADIGEEADYVVAFFEEPGEDAGGVETAGVGEADLRDQMLEEYIEKSMKLKCHGHNHDGMGEHVLINSSKAMLQ